MLSATPSVVLADLSFTWPDGTAALSGISAAFGAGRTGLIGLNGSGKSTLLRLITAELTPSSGHVMLSAGLGVLPQGVILDSTATVAGLLGIEPRLRALRSIADGDVSQHNFDVVGDDWDVEGRSAQVLAEAGLAADSLDRPVSTLSGGEAILVALAGIRLEGAPITLLDEPTNNLDAGARQRLYEMVATWRGALIVVSHDPPLLELMDDTAELRERSLSIYGGPYSAYLDHVERQQEAAGRALRSAEQTLKTQQRIQSEAQTKLARRARTAQTAFDSKRASKIVMNGRKSQAQVSAGKLRVDLGAKVSSAAAAVDAAALRLRDDDRISIDLAGTVVPLGRRLAELHTGQSSLIVQGQDRVALVGPNGAGKTSLLDKLVHGTERPGLTASAVAHTDRIGYLPQRIDTLDDGLTVLQNVARATPQTPNGEIRSGLARFLLRGDTVNRLAGTLSGGERFRVALARLLLADPPPQLVVLDEPSNNLDLHSIEQLVDALDAYRGGLIVVSHDESFLARLRLTHRFELGRSNEGEQG